MLENLLEYYRKSDGLSKKKGRRGETEKGEGGKGNLLLSDRTTKSVSVGVSFEKTERVCSLSLSHSLCFSTPNGQKLQPFERSFYVDCFFESPGMQPVIFLWLVSVQSKPA
jgi:hypothetical protein